MSLAAIILAAGAGTRMNSDLPKALHRVAGFPLVVHAMRTARAAGANRVVVVTGHCAAGVEAAVAAEDETATCARQDEQMGTAHAVLCAAEALGDHDDDIVVLYADTPFIQAGTIGEMARAHSDGAEVVVLGFHAGDPGRYGRLVTASDGRLERIVEARDATPEELKITLCNSGVVLARGPRLFALARGVGNGNASGEFYLTDIVAAATSAAAVTCPEAETLGVNSRADLAAAEAAFQGAARARAMEDGVTLTAPETVFFALDTLIGRDTEVGPHVVFGPGVSIETGAEIRAYCHLEGCHVATGAVIGPYARLRPGTEVGEGARIGNFVEVKAAILGNGAKANHLSYIGDATIGAGANIGAGTITCNYDGVGKHRTEIGDGAFIGSNAALVAPVRIGAEAMVAAGSAITGDVPDGALGLARGRQENKPGLARAIMARLKAARARTGKGA